MNIRLVVSSIALAALCLAPSLGWAQGSSHVMVTPNDLKWADVPSLPPGAKIAVIEGPLTEAGPITFRLKFPGGYKIPAHWHPAIEHVTVIAGTLNMVTGDKLDESKTMALTTGSIAIMQPEPTTSAGQRTRRSCRCTGSAPGA